jgi:hypothetical protein
LLALAITSSSGSSASSAEINYVPDEKTAVKIAEAILVPLYGEAVLKERPFQAKLEGGFWVIEGTLHASGPMVVGGVAHVEISKKDGAIRNVFHEK